VTATSAKNREASIMNTISEQTPDKLLADAKWNVKEANRLFMSEKRVFLSSNPIKRIPENTNIDWIDNHLRHTESKLEEIQCKFINWKIQRDAVELASIRNIDLKCIYLEERRRTATLYNSLDTALSLKQNQESQLYELNQKYLILQAEHQQALNHRTETDKLYAVLNATYEGEIKQMKEIVRAQERRNGENQSLKRRKLNGSKSTNNTTVATIERPNIEKKDKKTFKKIPCRLPVAPQSSLLSRLKTDSIVNMANRLIKEDSGTKAKSSKSKESLMGRKIQREFPGHGIFIGTVNSYKVPYYTICYDDGDTEEMNMTEMKKWLIDR
jgi:hypothetical protein